MNTTSLSPLDPARIDRLYTLLPAVHRSRDAEQGYPLKALLRVMAEQVNVIEDDIAQLYDDAFIETASAWAVPYLGELVGATPAIASGDVRVPREEVANTLRYRRRKGTLDLLEQLAGDVAAWPARAVEFFTLLGRAQHLNHLHAHRHRTVDLRETEALATLGTPFDGLTHSVDLRRTVSRRTPGRFNIPGVGVFVWRLLSRPVTDTPAYCVEEAGPHCFTFSVLGHDAPLFVRPRPEADPTHIAEELNLPVRLRRAALAAHADHFVGDALSFAVRTEGWAGHAGDGPVPAGQLVAADLTGWRRVPRPGQIAIDPERGRLAFPPGQLPKKGVRVSYHAGFPADLGGGEYARPLSQPSGDVTVYRVGDGEPHTRLATAVARWQAENPRHAVIEFTRSGVYVEPVDLRIADHHTLQLRAADGVRPVLRLIDWQTDLPDALNVTLGEGSRFTLDGLIVTGRPVRVAGAAGHEGASPCGAEVVIRHCTLVPGWGVDCGCEPRRPAEPSLELDHLRARVTITHSIVGAIVVQQDEVRADPIPLCITDSIVDATSPKRQALGAPGGRWAHVLLTIARSTVFGIVDVHAMPLGENSLFNGCVNVARRQVGCLRFSWVCPECRTPRRYRCQPDGVIGAAQARFEGVPDAGAAVAAEAARERLRAAPQFDAVRYGRPDYARLAPTCAPEITRGADDAAEMGVYHHLFQPQREANLRARLAEYTPAGMDVALLFAS